MLEIWKSVENYEAYLEVSNLGNVRSLDRFVEHKISNQTGSTGKIKLRFVKGTCLIQKLKKNGYLQIAIRLPEGNRKWFLVHRLVASAFIDNSLKLAQVDHINNNKQDNRVVNLQWNSAKQNCNKAVKDGLCSNEEKHHKAKLTKEQILEIRNMKGLHREIAKIYGVSRSTISTVKRLETWKYVE